MPSGPRSGHRALSSGSRPYYYRGFARLKDSKNAEAKADLEKFLELAPPTSPQVAQAKDLLAKIK
jgi:hypothetical protein